MLDLVPESGPSIQLFNHIPGTGLDHPSHRGRQLAQVDLPQNPAGRLVLTTGPGHGEDDSWDWAFAARFTGAAPGPPLVISPTRQILVEQTDGYEGGWADQFDETHWGAQSPAGYLRTQNLRISPPSLSATGSMTTRPATKTANAAVMGLRSWCLLPLSMVLNKNSTGVSSTHLRIRRIRANKPPGIALPLGQSGQLKFQMNAGPYDSNAYDWA